uniref:(northern house mosquito) hypothetical protein n=1 Tax=Culex pipiens TaxID=7175 RepID=A0A8D8EXK4_CULPI
MVPIAAQRVGLLKALNLRQEIRLSRRESAPVLKLVLVQKPNRHRHRKVRQLGQLDLGPPSTTLTRLPKVKLLHDLEVRFYLHPRSGHDQQRVGPRPTQHQIVQRDLLLEAVPWGHPEHRIAKQRVQTLVSIKHEHRSKHQHHVGRVGDLNLEHRHGARNLLQLDLEHLPLQQPVPVVKVQHWLERKDGTVVAGQVRPEFAFRPERKLADRAGSPDRTAERFCHADGGSLSLELQVGGFFVLFGQEFVHGVGTGASDGLLMGRVFRWFGLG